MALGFVRAFSSSARASAAGAVAAAAAPVSTAGGVRSALVLSRAPTLLREPSPLEHAVYSYNQKLNRHLAVPLNPDFYFKPGSSAELAYLKAEAERVKLDFTTIRSRGNLAAASVAATPAKGQPAEELVSAGQPTAANPAESVMDTSPEGEAEGAAESESFDSYAVRSRRTEADEANDQTSLDRAGDRTLYLLIKSRETSNAWRFPSDVVDLASKTESVPDKSEDAAEDAMVDIMVATDTLHAAAPRAVTKALGDSIDVWLLNSLPVGHAGEAGKEKVCLTLRLSPPPLS